MTGRFFLLVKLSQSLGERIMRLAVLWEQLACLGKRRGRLPGLALARL